ncbi:FAD-binding protein [Vibrio sp. OCN044]|uniref:FAD-binding protein n=1 Tax=Vibrio tetraodonis subsp. pristinus TaxID=2695891 RepID=A0A6L8LRY6_9VIBR|nr:FAD-binding protein [Vibrio tetraodonis]MYM58841.1 FAD-binding protein [Vibrio tetraodonis subsp. pristinus]
MNKNYLGDVANKIGIEKVLYSNSIGQNVSQFRQRELNGIVAPTAISDVQSIVNLAGNYDGIKLHPVSIGYNWGLGSKEDVNENRVLVDMSGLRQIREIDLEQGYAVIEPGVSQAHLSEKLLGEKWMINLTASSSHSSLIGNSLDRGVGLRHQRLKDLLGLEVILSDGRKVRVGWWPSSEKTAIYPIGVGPSLLHLFTQSNFAIVTAGVFKLWPKPDASKLVRIEFGETCLQQAIDELRYWSSQGLNSGVLKVYDGAANQTYGGKDKTFTAYFCIDGMTEDVNHRCQLIENLVAKSALFSNCSIKNSGEYVGDTISDLVSAAHIGDTSHNDHLLEATLGVEANQVDKSATGWLFFLPLLPFSGQSITKAYQIFDEIFHRTKIRCGATINALDDSVIDLVVAIRFKKHSSEAERAQIALNMLYDLFHSAGFRPYRLDVEHADWAKNLLSDPQTRNIVSSIRDVIDPTHLFSNDRYQG